MKRICYISLLILIAMGVSKAFAGQRLTFEGKTSAQITRLVSVPFPIMVDECLVQIGDSVQKGQKLVRYHLQARDARAFQGELLTGGGQADMQIQLSSIEQELLHTNAQKRTSAELAAKGLTSQADAQRNSRQTHLLMQRRQALQQKNKAVTADFTLRLAELESYFGHKLKKGDLLPEELFLISPMDADVINISPRVRPNGTVEPHVPAITLAVLNPIQIQVQVYESEIPRLHVGQEVTVEIVNMGKHTVKGKISMLSLMPIDAAIAVPSYYFMYVDIENPEHNILPGYKVLVHVDVE